MSEELMTDIIFTFRSPYVNWAAKMGFLVGVRSDRYRKDLQEIEPDFLDLNWKKPDLELHLEVCARVKPKYVVCPDILALSEVDAKLKYAENLQKHAKNVIVVPKCDCLHEVSENYVIGYSMPTQYGACELPEWYFQGRKIHLLGGSLKQQRFQRNFNFWDVVSIDGNGWTRALNFGEYIGKDGKYKQMRNVESTYQKRMQISLENIADFWKIKRLAA